MKSQKRWPWQKKSESNGWWSNGSSTTQSGGVGVVLYHEEDKAVALSFKLEFSCSNNMVKYEAHLTGLATTFEMGIKHLRVMGDSNLVVCQTKRSFSIK